MPLEDRQHLPDVICMGRAGVDLYAVQENVPFEQVTTLRKSFGGSPANIAVGLARLGNRVGFIGKLSADMIGESVRLFLNNEGINTDGVALSTGESRTGIALTETRPDHCRVVIYRNQAADLQIFPMDIDPAYVARARLLVVSGTALSASPSREAVFRAVELVRQHGGKIFTDLDYRPYSWKNPVETAEVYQEIAQKSDYLIGNTEEFACFRALPGHTDAAASVKLFLDHGVTWVFLKAGSEGSTAFSGETVIHTPAFSVQAKKPFGAGDAFAASLIHGILAGADMTETLHRAAAAAALVVAAFGCAESMPTAHEIQAFVDRS